jgi:hypothetical protein
MGALGGLLLLIVPVTLAAPQAPITIDRIVAVVNGGPITLSDVRAARVLGLAEAGATDAAILEGLIDRRLVLAEMRRFQIPEPAPAALARRRQEWEQRIAGSDLEDLLRTAGVASAFVDRWLADDLRREAYLQQRFAALDADRQENAIRLWMEGLRVRANIVYRVQRF